MRSRVPPSNTLARSPAAQESVWLTLCDDLFDRALEPQRRRIRKTREPMLQMAVTADEVFVEVPARGGHEAAFARQEFEQRVGTRAADVDFGGHREVDV